MRKLGLFPAIVALLALGAVLGLAQEDRKVPRAHGPLPGNYVGEAACKECHLKEHRTWKATGHAKAHEIVPAKYKDDSTCTVCHATGLGQPGGFVSVAKTPGMAGVQCEACHGPGADHVQIATAATGKSREDATVQAKFRESIPSEAGQACARCHVTESHGTHPDFEGATEDGRSREGEREER